MPTRAVDQHSVIADLKVVQSMEKREGPKALKTSIAGCQGRVSAA